MKKSLKERVYEYNRVRAAETEKAGDFMTLLEHLPPAR